MTQAKNRLGTRVVGDERAAEEAAAENATIGHQHTLGPRVTGILQAVPSAHRQQANATALGHRVTDGTHAAADLSVEELKELLDENATFFDSLYIGELHRKGGPRVAALRVFENVEANSKQGAARAFILDEIHALLGTEDSADPVFVEREIEARRQAYEEQQQRMTENAGRVATAQTALTTEGRVQEIMHDEDAAQGTGTGTGTGHTETPSGTKSEAKKSPTKRRSAK